MKKAFRKSLAFLLSLTLLFCAVPFSWVEASAAEPIPLDAEVTPSSGGSYTIANAEQLKRLSDIVKGGNECTGATFTLTEDIVLNPGELTVDTNGDPLYNGSAVGVDNQPEKWFPIGYIYDLDGNGTDENVIFKGAFDGNGHTVSGLFFNNTKQDCVGLFGLAEAKIKNVGVIKSYIRGREYVGGVCGSNAGKLSNCYNTGIMIGTYNNVGGVCGFNVGKLSNCYNTGTVSGTDSFVGGVCGYNNYTIINCYNIGSVSGTNTVVGGVCGFNSGELSNCYNTDSVSGAGYIGGVCGTNKYVIMNCYNTGTVSGNIKIGGVCGHNISDDTIINCYYLDTACGNAGGGESKTEQEMKDAAFVSSLGSHYISSFFELNGGYPLLKSLCEFTGDGTATAPYLIYTANQLNYMSYLVNFDNEKYGDKYYKLMANIVLNPGELTADTNGDPLYNGIAVGVDNQPEKWFPIGYIYDLDGNGTDENAIFKGVFDGDSHTVSGLFLNNTEQDSVGLFGQADDDAKIKNVGVIKSYIRGKMYVGGVCGLNGGELSNCYNTGNVSGTVRDIGGVCGLNGGELSNCYNTGIVSGTDSFVGGVCGINGGKLSNCYNIGSVSGTNTVVGGVCGFNDGELSNCYNTDSVSGVGYIGGVCGTNKHVIMNCYNIGIVSGRYDNVGGVCGYNDGNVPTTNCYYLDTSCGNAGGGTSKTFFQFNSGEVCSLLNSEKTDGTQAFYQNLDTNAENYPTLDNSHGTVYNGYDNTCIISYANIALSSTLTHSYVCTSNDDGTHTKTCSVCSEETEGHTETADCTYSDVVTAPTCTADGYTTHRCIVCYYSYTDTSTSATGHTFGDWVSDGNATFFKDGTKTHACVCGETETVTEKDSAGYKKIFSGDSLGIYLAIALVGIRIALHYIFWFIPFM